MQTKIKILSLLSAVLLSAPLFAAGNGQLQIKDFLFSAPLDDASSSLRRLPLNASILQNIQTAGINDIRVFDAAGRIVPALVRRSERPVAASKHALNFFPLYGNKVEDVQLASTDIERDDSGRVMAIHSRQSRADHQNILTGYVIDQSAYQNENLSELEFEIKNTDAQYMMSLRIDTSDDLSHWSTLKNAAVIAHFQVDDKILSRNTVSLSAHAQRYLRVTLLSPVENFVLQTITAHYNHTGAVDNTWLSLGKPKPVIVNGREQYEFVLPGGVMPALVKFQFAGNDVVAPGLTNGLISGRLYSLNRQHKWVPRQSITQYKIVLKQGELESRPVHLAFIRPPLAV